MLSLVSERNQISALLSLKCLSFAKAVFAIKQMYPVYVGWGSCNTLVVSWGNCNTFVISWGNYIILLYIFGVIIILMF